jgi:hypothetical protein
MIGCATIVPNLRRRVTVAQLPDRDLTDDTDASAVVDVASAGTKPIGMVWKSYCPNAVTLQSLVQLKERATVS